MANIAQGAFDAPPLAGALGTARPVNEKVDTKGQPVVSDIAGLGAVLQDIRAELRLIREFLELHSDMELETEDVSQ